MMMREGIPSIAGSGRHSACIVFITAALLLCVLEAKPLSQEGWGRRLTGQQKMNQQGANICSQGFPAVPMNWRPHGKVLALTFDDGPHAASLTAVLDVLKNESVPATFFVNTYAESGWLGPFNSPANVAAMKRLLAEGHELGSHAAIHLHLGELPTAEAKQQIEWAVGNISAVTGSKSVPLFRAPYGDGFVLGVTWPIPKPAHRQLWDVARQHHVHVAWSFSGDDYKVKGDAAGCADRLFNAYGPPLVQQRAAGPVLMHSTNNAMGGCPEALKRLIPYWRSHGYTFAKTADFVEEIYGMTPEEVVEKARACGPAGGRERGGPALLPSTVLQRMVGG